MELILTSQARLVALQEQDREDRLAFQRRLANLQRQQADCWFVNWNGSTRSRSSMTTGLDEQTTFRHERKTFRHEPKTFTRERKHFRYRRCAF